MPVIKSFGQINLTLGTITDRGLGQLKAWSNRGGWGGGGGWAIVGSVNRITVTERIKAPFLV